LERTCKEEEKSSLKASLLREGFRKALKYRTEQRVFCSKNLFLHFLYGGFQKLPETSRRILGRFGKLPERSRRFL
jgi:hypothetical protein